MEKGREVKCPDHYLSERECWPLFWNSRVFVFQRSKPSQVPVTLEKPHTDSLFCSLSHMQVLDMRTLRIFYTHKHLFNLAVPKSLSIPRFSRYLHSTFPLRCAEPSETTPHVWSIYGRAPDRLPSQTVSSSSDGNEGAKRPNDRNRKKGKGKVSWVCAECGNSDGQWWGSCRACNAVGTMTRFSEGNSLVSVSEAASGSWLPQQAGELRPLRLTDVNRGINRLDWRISL